ncbi:hypothetical protein DBV15_07192 [Temnothorax longispinosus]|uniref:Uncharacterized protein n=1 Tax=Temnothorax longispinosus TaxID=300112 RepID=A0A4S2JQK8_9HYME|nr:hypothetical protein DBV15_07192 [Temnothorax longispinosus]
MKLADSLAVKVVIRKAKEVPDPIPGPVTLLGIKLSLPKYKRPTENVHQMIDLHSRDGIIRYPMLRSARRGSLDPARAHRPNRPNSAGTCDPAGSSEHAHCATHARHTLPAAPLWGTWPVFRPPAIVQCSVSFVRPISDSSDSLTRASVDRDETRRRPEGLKD